jgi:hypothetical protein
MTDREVLAMLRGSPDGTTEAMAAAHGIKRRQLDRLVAAGKARVEERTLRQPPVKIPTFFFNSQETQQ